MNLTGSVCAAVCMELDPVSIVHPFCLPYRPRDHSSHVSSQKKKELLLLAVAKPLEAEDTMLYSSVTMRVNCLSLDRPDLSFAVGPLARGMQNPTTKDLEQTW